MATELEILVKMRDEASKQLNTLTSNIKQHQKAIGIGMVAAGGAIMAGLGMSMKAAADFEGAMREVNTMMGLSQGGFAAFSKDVQKLSTDLGVDAVESAKAMYQAISAGIPEGNAIEFLTIATKAAIGGVTDTKTAVDGLSTVINAFKLPLSDTQKVADLMFTTVKGGKTTFEELSASLFQVAPIAAASGVSFEEVSAALATMTKQGVPTKIATTQLRQAMVALQKPTADMSKVIQGMGYESGQAMLGELGLAKTLNVLRDSTEGSNEQLMAMFGSVEAGAAILALTGDNASMLTADLEAMAKSEGAATDAFNEMEKGASRQMAALKESVQGITISIGNALLPILTDLIETMKPVIESIKNWVAENPEMTKVIVIASLALGVLLTTLGGLLLVLPGIIAAGPLVGAAFTLMLGPVGLVIATVAALIAIGILLWKNWDKVKLFFIGMWLTLTDIFKVAWDTIKQYTIDPLLAAVGWITTTWGTLITFFSGLVVSMRAIFNQIAQAMYQPIKIAIDWIINMVNNMIRAINMATTKVGISIPTIPFKMPDLPSFDQGGIAMKPMIARVAGNGPEAMIPLNKLDTMGGNRRVNIIVELDGKAIARAIGLPLVDLIRVRTGARI